MTIPNSSDSRSGGVFISHHSSRYEAAKVVKAALAEQGIRGWLAPDDVDPGSAFDTQIVDQIKRSQAIVLLLSPEADQSRHVKRELMLADDEGIAVFPVRLEPIKAEGLAYFLKDRQWIDWFGGKGEGLARLVEAVHQHGAGPLAEPRPDPLPTPPPAPRRRWARIVLAIGLPLVVAGGVAAWLLVPRLTEPEPVVRPGLWLNKREMLAVVAPKVTDEAAAQIKGMVENDPNPEECISEDVARNPDVRLFDPGNKGKCQLTGFQVGSGRMSGYLTCPVQGAAGAAISIVFRGSYTPTTLVIDQDVTMAQPGHTLQFKARDSSHWVAEKCPTERR